MPEKHTFEFIFPDDRNPDAADQQRLLEDMQLFASRLGATVALSSVETVDYCKEERIQMGLNYELHLDDRISQRTRNILGGYGGFLTCRDVLVTGQNALGEINSFGEVSVDEVKLVLADKVPELPFLDAPDPAFAASFSTHVSQIHFGATGSWNTGHPSKRITIGDVVTYPGHYCPDVVHDARNYARHFRAARKEITINQKI